MEHIAATAWRSSKKFALNRRLLKAYLLKESLDRPWD
jgi:hypothetical protein